MNQWLIGMTLVVGGIGVFCSLAPETQEMQSIDAEIERLKADRNYHLWRARRLDQEADRAYANSRSTQDARRLRQIGDEHREKAYQLQLQVDGLEEKKKNLPK